MATSWFEWEAKMLTPSSIATYIVLPIVATYLLLGLFKWRRKVKLLDKLSGPKAYPILGNALDFLVSPAELFKRLNQYCTPEFSMIRLWIGLRPYCLLYKAQSVEVVLSSQKLLDKNHDYVLLHPWLGYSLLTSTGNYWRNRRKMLTPAFHFKILEDFVHIFNEQSFKLVSILEAKAGEKPFDVKELISLCTLDIILETAMGRSIDVQNNSDCDYVKALHKISSIFQLRQFRPWLNNDFLFKLSKYSKQQDQCLETLHKLTNETIQERKKELEEKQKFESKEGQKNEGHMAGKKKTLAFLDLLLQSAEQSQLSDEDIRAEVDTFMFEGHDTTAYATNWAIYLLGRHPEIQKRVHEELDSIFENSDRHVTSKDLSSMKYLECCIKEALRILPSVPMFARLLKEDELIDGYKLPAGTNVILFIYKLHRDPAYFPEPELYKPERFLPENSIGRHPYAYVPFSAGPRNCIGQKFAQMEEKIILANIFRHYRVESTLAFDDLKLQGDIILKPGAGNLIKLFHRTDDN